MSNKLPVKYRNETNRTFLDHPRFPNFREKNHFSICRRISTARQLFLRNGVVSDYTLAGPAAVTAGREPNFRTLSASIVLKDTARACSRHCREANPSVSALPRQRTERFASSFSPSCFLPVPPEAEKLTAFRVHPLVHRASFLSSLFPLRARSWLRHACSTSSGGRIYSRRRLL